MLLLGIDLGTSSIKVSVVDAQSGSLLASVSYPEKEMEILSQKAGWAEQSPETWWLNVQHAIKLCNSKKQYDPKNIAAIGIAYQMHGLVITDKNQKVLRNSIIWCDSRAVEIGNKAFADLGGEKILPKILNSPGNFTASKLAWVKQNEPSVYDQVDKMMLPGDFIALKMTGSVTTSPSALSEGILWDFKENKLSRDVMKNYGFDEKLIPEIKLVYANHGELNAGIANELGLKPNIPITYKSGDQPNNALSLNVSEPGEVAATAGTSGVIYAVTDTLLYDKKSRVNTFAHVNHTEENKRLGVLLCINGTGSMNRWAKNTFAENLSYNQINDLAATAKPGSKGLQTLPFGNGAERMLSNKNIGASIENIDLNRHGKADILRSVQEGIAFSFRYGLDILRENGLKPSIIKAGKANLFLSDVFTQTFVNVTGVPIQLYENDGSYGAAIGAGIGLGVYKSSAEAFKNKKALKLVEPNGENLDGFYQEWKSILMNKLNSK
ncbi:carbohydrate kinase [Pedobacter sp. SD-b]|uniref:Carbohydrate kinase n=1 Tax=Pedobacter segetis TaxID=2793069 RepID=A0ABS1BF41_9SPHI|nr:FGGY family carbohydrate kinase [Pedobacter segetis]MBK0381463.1 carbohydrate kinase [Pedobacter segetis]